jgi:hypothetical protein
LQNRQSSGMRVTLPTSAVRRAGLRPGAPGV